MEAAAGGLMGLIRRKRQRLDRYRLLAARLAQTPYGDVVRAVLADEASHVQALERAAATLRPPSPAPKAAPARPRLRVAYVIGERVWL